jgi:hypothetical protein
MRIALVIIATATTVSHKHQIGTCDGFDIVVRASSPLDCICFATTTIIIRTLISLYSDTAPFYCSIVTSLNLWCTLVDAAPPPFFFRISFFFCVCFSLF